MARSVRANAAALSPRPILISARSPIRRKIFRLFFEERFEFAARLSPTFLGGGWSPATSCAQPNQKRSSPLK